MRRAAKLKQKFKMTQKNRYVGIRIWVKLVKVTLRFLPYPHISVLVSRASDRDWHQDWRRPQNWPQRGNRVSPYPKHHIKQLTLLRLSYLKSQGVKMVFATDLVTNVFHEFAEYLYGKNMQVRRWGSEQIFYQRGLKSGAARLGAGEVLSGESQLRRPPGFFIISGNKPLKS